MYDKNLKIFVLKGDFGLDDCRDVTAHELQELCGRKLFPFVHGYDKTAFGGQGCYRVELRYNGCFSGPHMFYFETHGGAKDAAYKLAKQLNTVAQGNI